MLLRELVAACAEVTRTRSRTRKIELLAGCVASMDLDEVAVGASYAAGTPRQERVDVGWATLRAVDPPASGVATLELLEVDRALERLAGVRGAGSRAVRLEVLGALLSRATAEEQRFLRGLLLGELRQGALAGIVTQAVARAAAVPERDVRRAAMLRGDLGVVAQAAMRGGRAALQGFHLELFRPLQPMLAQTASDLAEVVADVGSAAVEDKLDGARIQVHRRGSDVRVYTRNLRDVTDRMPDVLAVVAGLSVDTVVLDGEVLALRPDGSPQPFQDTMRRFGTERALDELRARLVLRPFFFDCLHLDGEDVLDQPFSARVGALHRAVPAEYRVHHRVVDDAEAAATLLAAALDRGHEGVMVKALDAPYEAGRRGAAWRKLKPVHTLDLVVLAVEWGSGRRRGWLSNIHLGARDADSGGFVMLGKTFKGMTDAMLQWQTARFLELEERRDGHVVHVRPEQVVEVAFDGVQQSPRYPGGLALRFARVKRYRDDKTAHEADTIDVVRAMHGGAAAPTPGS